MRSKLKGVVVRALIIDDSKAIRFMLRKMFTDLGFEVLEAGHGLEALERLKESDKVDLALVDWNMPEMNGYDFVCEVRKDKNYDELRMMMVTTETEMSQVVKALEAGANEYVMKPFTKEVIVEKLNLIGLNVT